MTSIIKSNKNKGKPSTHWHNQHEQSAGIIRLEILWRIYKIFGLRTIKLILYPVSFFIALFARTPRHASYQYRQILNAYQSRHNLPITRFSSFAHIRTFAYSLIDKLSANCDKKTPLKFTHEPNNDYQDFKKILAENHGAFLICSHLGNIEALCAISDARTKTMHAFMQVTQTQTFHKFMTNKSVNRHTILHPTENIDISVAGTMYDNLCQGDLVMMAGDRTSATAPHKTIPTELLGTPCHLPLGVFKFARGMSHPVFAIALLNTGGCNYKLYLKRLDTNTTTTMASQYTDFLNDLLVRYPKQWFNFYKYFQN